MKAKHLALAGALLLFSALAGCGKPLDEDRSGELLSPEQEQEFLPEEVLPEGEKPLLPPADENRPGEENPEETEQKRTENEDTLEENDDDPQQKPPEKIQEAAYVRVLCNGLNVRTGAGTEHGSMGLMETGTLLPLIAQCDGWYETRYCGKRAYVSANAAYTEKTQLKKGEAQTERVIEVGEELLGTPYVYGAVRLHDGSGRLLQGFTPTRFDCSSLMQYIFYQGADVLLNMTTRTQILQGKAVAWEEIARGDLLFFTNAARRKNQGIERVGHVALYLGENYILHTASDFAKIEQITPLRKSYFLSARRLL